MRSQSKFIVWFGLANAVAILLFVVGVLRNQSFDYWYVVYNLVLAYIPLGLAFLLKHLVEKRAWRNWRVGLTGLLWLLFLPNSFYIVTDFIHLYEQPRIDIIQDVVMLLQFSVLGLLAGFASLSILHSLLLKKVGQRNSAVLVLGVLYLCSFALFLGRELRWNSWDVVVRPLGIVNDMALLWQDPAMGMSAFIVTLSFFGVLASMYFMGWYGVRLRG